MKMNTKMSMKTKAKAQQKTYHIHEIELSTVAPIRRRRGKPISPDSVTKRAKPYKCRFCDWRGTAETVRLLSGARQ